MTVETDLLIHSLGFHWGSQDVHGCPPPWPCPMRVCQVSKA